MNIRNEKEKKAFVAYNEDGKEMGKMVYSLAKEGKMITIDHTEVDPAFQGQKVGDHLIQNLIAWAREEKAEIWPVCPFAVAYFKKHPGEYGDVLLK